MEKLITRDRTQILLKEAIIGAFEEKKDMFYELFVEAIEDTALANAIKEGEKTKSVNRDNIFRTLGN